MYVFNIMSEEYKKIAQRYYNHMMERAGKDMQMRLSSKGELLPKDALTELLLPHYEKALELEAKGVVVRYDQQDENNPGE